MSSTPPLGEPLHASLPDQLILEINISERWLLSSRTMKHGSVSSKVHGGGKRRGFILAGI
jgi:hypothetical protein